MTPINLRAAEARALIDAGKVEVVRVMRDQPSVATATDAAWRDAKCDLWRNKAQYTRDCCPLPAPGAVVVARKCDIRLHARVESRGAEVRDGKWYWVAWLAREEGGE